MRVLKTNSLRIAANEAALSALLVSLCFQNITLFSIAGASIKPFHVITLILLIASIASQKSHWSLPNKWFLLASLYTIGVSLFDSIRFGVSIVLFNYAFFFIMIVAVLNYGNGISLQRWGAVIRSAALLVLVIVIIKIIIYSDVIIGFVSYGGNGHPLVPSFFSDSVNLEASWLALFGVFFEKNKTGLVYLISSLSISALYASRVGIILSLLSLIYVLLVKSKNRIGVSRLAGILLLTIGLIAVAQIADLPIVDRFLAMGEDKGSTGRTNMWQYAFSAFVDAPMFGNGVGNAIPHLEMVSGTFFSEDNIHNYPLQVLLDLGFFGFVFFVAMVVSVVSAFRENRFSNPFAAYILCWVVGSLFQFRGADALLAFFIAGYLLMESTKAEPVDFVPDNPSFVPDHSFHS